jgi:alkylation response protein AidB-like acyl-CoA dehydrogenase
VDFAFSFEQDELRRAVRRFLAASSDEAAVRDLMATDVGFDAQAWQTMAAELGLQGLLIPEGLGGGGSAFLDICVVLEEMGRSLLCAPFLSSAVLATTALLISGNDALCAEHLPAMAAGDLIATLALSPGRQEDDAAEAIRAVADGDGYVLIGSHDFVLDGHIADLLIVPATIDGEASPSLFVVGPAEPADRRLSRTLRTTLDATRKVARIDLDEMPAVPLSPAAESAAMLSKLHVVAAAAIAAEQVGGCQWGVATTTAYASIREQFGRTIGSFQVVKHMCVDMYVQCETAMATAYYAAWALSTDSPDVEVAVAVAKAECSNSAVAIARETIQVHGGIGFTWDHPAHLYYRRAESSALLFGTAESHLEAINSLLAAE